MNFKPSLLAYAKALDERSFSYFFYRQILHILALCVAVVSTLLVIETYLVYTLATVAMFIEFLAWCFRYLGERNHRKSRKLNILGLFYDAFGKLSDNSIEVVDSLNVDSRIQKRAEQLDKEWEKSGGFFASNASVGVFRLLENLQESAFFSKHLCEKASQYIFWFLGILFTGILITFFVLLFDGSVWFPRVITLLFVFVIADELSFGFAWWEAANHFADILKRLNVILKGNPDCLEVILSILCDYQVAAVVAPPVPRYVYFLHRDKLNADWDKIKQDREP